MREDVLSTYQPLVFESDDPQLAVLTNKGVPVYNTLEGQAVDVIEYQYPFLSKQDRIRRAEMLVMNKEWKSSCRWVFYPWRNSIFCLLGSSEFAEVRTSRNQHKVTKQEQTLLATKTVGIVGLSVGSAIAETLALEGIGSRFRLADFDTISLSNTNRLSCGVTALGQNKAVRTAQKLFEINPYLEIEVYQQGVATSTLADFFGKDETVLDVLVEECDDFAQKILLREKAKQLGVPVVMETNDRGMLDIERYDVDRSYPILHGLIDGLTADAVSKMTTKQKIPYVLKVAGNPSPLLAASLIEIDSTISGWPQLASDVALGAALVTNVVRRIFCGDIIASGRVHVDLTKRVCDEQLQTSRTLVAENQVAKDTQTVLSPLPVQPPGRSKAITREDAAFLVYYATRAPSGGNVQPWEFVFYAPGTLECRRSAKYQANYLDKDYLATNFAIGAAVENIILAASAIGIDVVVGMEPAGRVAETVCVLHLSRNPNIRENALFPTIAKRVTNRKICQSTALSQQEERRLYKEKEDFSAELSLVSHPDGQQRMGNLVAEIERFRVFHPRMHREMMSEVRWSDEEAIETRDGLEIATLELPPEGEAGLRLLRSSSTMDVLRSIPYSGRGLIKDIRDSIVTSSAIGWVTAKDTCVASFVDAGRCFERIWLAANQMGIGIQPITAGVYLRLRRQQELGELGWQLVDDLATTMREYSNTSVGVPTMLFRLHRASSPKVRSLRKQVSDVLTVYDERNNQEHSIPQYRYTSI